MKKLLALILALLTVLSISACGMTQDDLDTAIDILDAVLEQVDETSDGDISDDTDTLPEPDIVPDVPDFSGMTDDKEDGPDVPTEPDAPADVPADIPDGSDEPDEPEPEPEPAIDEHGTYDSKEDVALYIYTYGRLPDNYITKDEARDLGWEGGSVEEYAPGMCIGGSRFGNYEGLLPEKKGRTYLECDIDTLGKSSRGAKRIVFSNDGLIYYTDDHYESFELLYGEVD